MSISYVGPTTAHFDGMCWPRPCDALDEVQHRLRYGTPSRSDLLVAAEVIAAYDALVNAPERKRRDVVRAIRLTIGAAVGPWVRALVAQSEAS